MPGTSSAVLDDTAFSAFALHVGFHERQAVVRVRGDLDASTAPTLRAHLRALMDLGHVRVVLDLAALTFMDAAGLGVIATTSSHLLEAGGALVLRDTPAACLQILDIAGLTARVHIEESRVSVRLQAELVRATSVLARREILDAQLLIVVAVASATLDGADGVSVTLERDGGLTTVAASNDTVLEMDAHQYDTGEGPCLSAATDGQVFHIESLVEEARWPAFVPLAVGEGIASILSVPLVTGGRPVGALNIYSNTAGAFGSAHCELATTFAEQASRIVDGERTGIDDDGMAVRVAEALRSRLILGQAQGVLMNRHRMTADEASAALHRAARAGATTVLAHAADVVASTQADLGPLDRLGRG